VHRIGRTARAGADGMAISLCSGDEVAYLRDIEKLIRMAIPSSGKQPVASRPAPQPQQARGGRPDNNRGAKSQRGRQQQKGRKRHNGEHRPAPSSGGERQASQPTQSRPIASTQPLNGDFTRVAFMQQR
jgi:superfamily II DNA/RNA helicase